MNPKVKIRAPKGTENYIPYFNYEKVIADIISGNSIFNPYDSLNPQNKVWYDTVCRFAGLSFLDNGVVESPGLSISLIQGDKSHFIVREGGNILILQGFVNYSSYNGYYRPTCAVECIKTPGGLLINTNQGSFEEQMEKACDYYSNRQGDLNNIAQSLSALTPAFFTPRYLDEPFTGHDGLTPF